MSIDLITSAQRNLPTYVTDFCSMIRTYYQDQIQKVRAEYLPCPIINTTLRSLCTDNPVCMTCHGTFFLAYDSNKGSKINNRMEF